jgi:hypothetical protein
VTPIRGAFQSAKQRLLSNPTGAAIRIPGGGDNARAAQTNVHEFHDYLASDPGYKIEQIEEMKGR